MNESSLRKLLAKIIEKLEWFAPHSIRADLEKHSSMECASILLRDAVHPDNFLYLSDGAVIKGLCDLENVLKEMDDKTFKAHVTKHRNDFSNWVDKIIGDHALAKKMNELDSKEEFEKAVKVRVNFIKNLAQNQSEFK